MDTLLDEKYHNDIEERHYKKEGMLTHHLNIKFSKQIYF